MKDLTVGHPGKVLVAYTLPLFGSIIFQQLYNIADSFVAGHYIGTAALSAVSNSYEITLIYIALAFGCNIGTSVVTARLFGQKAYGEVRTAVSTALIFSAVLGVVLALAGLWLGESLLLLINTPAELMRDSKDYLDIYLWGYVFLILYQVSTGIFSALGDSRTPFWFLAVSSVANIFVDVVFVRDLGLGVKGVAYATFLCQSLSGIAALIALLRKLREVKGGESRVFSGRMLGSILCIAAPSAVQQSCISVGNILIQSVINSMGAAVMGGYGAAVKLNNMCITSLTAAGNGISNYTSQNVGAGRHSRIRSGAGYASAMGVGIALAFTAVFQLFAAPLVRLFISDGNAEAIAAGVSFLRIVSPFYAVIAVKLMSDGILRGLTLMTPFMVSTMTDLILRVVLAFAFAPRWHSSGVWAAWPIGWFVGTALSVMFYWRWQRRHPGDA